MPRIHKSDLISAAEAGRFNKKDRAHITLRLTASELAIVKTARHAAKAHSLNSYIVGRLIASDSTAGRMRDEDVGPCAPNAFNCTQPQPLKQAWRRSRFVAEQSE